jgi:hypothetical protein
MLIVPQEAATASGMAKRSISVAGARVLSQQLRDAVGCRHELAIARVGRSYSCSLDLHALLPLPEPMLRLGPHGSDTLAWLWGNWGTPCRCARFRTSPANRRPGRVHVLVSGLDPAARPGDLGPDMGALRFDARPTYGLS